MGVLPPTGSLISFNRTTHAFYNTPNGTAASLTGSLNPAIGRASGINTPFSNVFGGRNTPYSY